MQEQGRSTEGELWLSEGALHWTSAPMSDITNRAPTRDSCQPANGGFRIAMGDVESVRSVGDTRPTLEVKLTTMSDPVLLIFLGPGEDTEPSARPLGQKQKLTWSGSCVHLCLESRVRVSSHGGGRGLSCAPVPGEGASHRRCSLAVATSGRSSYGHCRRPSCPTSTHPRVHGGRQPTQIPDGSDMGRY